MVPSTSLLSQSALLYVRGDSFVSGLTFLSLDNMVPGGLARLRLFRGVPDYCTALAAQTGHKPLPLNEIQVEFISKACIRLHPKHYSKRCIHVLYVWMHVCMHTCMHACIYLLLYVCMQLCTSLPWGVDVSAMYTALLYRAQICNPCGLHLLHVLVRHCLATRELAAGSIG